MTEPRNWRQWLVLKAGLLATHLSSYAAGFFTASLMPVDWPALFGAVPLQTLGRLLAGLAFLLVFFVLLWFVTRGRLFEERDAREKERAEAEAERQKMREQVFRHGLLWDARGMPCCPACRGGLVLQQRTYWCPVCKIHPLGDGPGPSYASGGGRVF